MYYEAIILLEYNRLQLACPWIAEWAYTGIFAVADIFQTKTSFGFLTKKSGFHF